jgi:hypothetical protein
MQSKGVFFAVAILCCFCLHGQIVNIESRRIYEDTSGWSGSLDGNFSVTQNGDMLFSTGLRPRVQYKTRKNYFFLLSDVMYTASKANTYSNQGMSHFRYARRIKNGPWKWESFTQVQYNQLLNQRIRFLVGTGLRWKFIDTNQIRFFAGSSTFYEYEELTVDGVINQNFRWSNYLSWFIYTKTGFSFTGITYYQPRWDKFNDYRFSGQYSVSQAINKRLDLRIEASIFYDAAPPTNVRSTVFNSTAGFRLRLGE